MYIDYSKIAGNNYNLYFDEEKLNELKELAENEKNLIMYKYKFKCNNMTSVLTQKAHDVVYVNQRNIQLSNVEKTIVACNIVFDDEKFVNILKKGNFDNTCLETYIKLVYYMKKKVDNNRLSEDDQRYLNTVDTYTKKLVNHFSKYVGVVDKHIIINKLNEILSFRPELLEDKTKKYNR